MNEIKEDVKEAVKPAMDKDIQKPDEIDNGKNISQASQNVSKTANEARNDEKDIADPGKGKGFDWGSDKKGREKPIEETTGYVESQKDSLGVKSVDVNQAKNELPNQEQNEKIQDDNSSQNVVKKPVEKEEKKEEKNVTDSVPQETKTENKEEERKVSALGKTSDYSLGVGVSAKGNDLEPTHFIGTQKRGLLENGQQVVELKIDKEAWLKASPDKKGMLKVSLYDPKNSIKDGFSDKVLMIPHEKVRALQADENGKLKLIVAENEPGKKNTRIEVFEDTQINRERIIAKNPNPLGDTPALQRERALDAKLEHGFYGYKMDVTMRDIRNNMNPEKQAQFDKLDHNGVKEVINNPANKEKYTEYEEKLNDKKLESFKQGSTIKVNGSVIGKDDVIAVKLKFEKEEGEKIFVKDENNQTHKLEPTEVLKGNLSKEDEARVKTETLKEIATGIDVNPKIAQNEALEQKVTEKTTYKEYVENMSPSDQAIEKNKTPNEINATINENKEKLRENEKNVLDGKSIGINGEMKEKPDPAKELSKAILNGKKEDVDKLIESGVKADKSHIKLMNEMKSSGRDLDPKIEQTVKASIPEQSVKVKM
jgi:hypothetical protein